MYLNAVDWVPVTGPATDHRDFLTSLAPSPINPPTEIFLASWPSPAGIAMPGGGRLAAELVGGAAEVCSPDCRDVYKVSYSADRGT